EMPGLPEIPIFVDGADEKTKKILEALAHSISDDEVELSDDDERMKLHVAAVVVSNFTNYLYTLAEEYCRKENIDFKLLLPLIEEVAQRIKNISPSQTQTGPAIRNDLETIEKHLALLDKYPELKKVYEFLSLSIAKSK
ncbi:MAG: DUF2520 domain-containing protein, partial [Chitinophagaceae bacterium]